MEPRRTSARRAGLVALAALLVASASGCSGGKGLVGTAPAATVNGVEISQATLMDTVTVRHDFYQDQAKQAGGATGDLASILGELKSSGTDTVGTSGTARTLSDLIADEVIRQKLEALDALPTKKDRDAIRSSLEQQAGGAEALAKIDKTYLAQFIQSQALNQAYTTWAAAQANKKLKPYTAAERTAQKDALYQQSYAGNPLCLNLIQTQTKDAAAAAKVQVDGGTDFVTVAQTAAAAAGVTLPDGGFIACLPVDQATQAFGQDFSKVAVADVVGPLEYKSQNGTSYLLARVESVNGLTREQAETVLDAQVPAAPTPADPSSYDARAELNALLAKADVTVNPQFGRWSPVRSSVVPPRAPKDPTVTTTTKPKGSKTTATTVPVATVAGS